MNNMFSIRKATTDDCQLIQELADKIWWPTYGAILSKEQSDYMLDMMYSTAHLHQQMNELHHQYFIIFKDDKPAGYLSIETVDSHLYIFQKVYSLPELHGIGIGRFIIEKGVEYLKSIAPHPFTVMLYVNRENPAYGFYKHVGFKDDGTRDYDIGRGYQMNDYILKMEID